MISLESFINSNKQKWQSLENLLSKNRLSYSEAGELGNLYQEMVEDLSYSQTHFPGEPVTAYLNQNIIRCHLRMHEQRTPAISGIILFFTHTLPMLLAGLWKPIMLSLVLFLGAVFLSFFMVLKNPEFAEIFLSGEVYEKAIEDLELRKQFGNFDNIPSASRPLVSFEIWVNNSKVALYAFVFGATVGLGTLYIIVSNSLMLGALLAVYFKNGQFLDFFSLIMVHGSIELTAIILAAGMGFSIAGSILFPGRKPRLLRLKETVRQSFYVTAGIVAMLLIAGTLEGMVTTMKLPIPLRLAIALVNFLWMGLYFGYGMKINSKSKSGSTIRGKYSPPVA